MLRLFSAPEECHYVEILTVVFCRVHHSAPVGRRILVEDDQDTSGEHGLGRLETLVDASFV